MKRIPDFSKTNSNINRVFVIAICLTFYIPSVAQSPLPGSNWESSMYEAGASFYEIEKSAFQRFDSALAAGVSLGYEFKEFNRWQEFWQYRVDKANSGKSGSFEYAQQAVAASLQDPICTG